MKTDRVTANMHQKEKGGSCYLKQNEPSLL